MWSSGPTRPAMTLAANLIAHYQRMLARPVVHRVLRERLRYRGAGRFCGEPGGDANAGGMPWVNRGVAINAAVAHILANRQDGRLRGKNAWLEMIVVESQSDDLRARPAVISTPTPSSGSRQPGDGERTGGDSPDAVERWYIRGKEVTSDVNVSSFRTNGGAPRPRSPGKNGAVPGPLLRGT